MDSMRGFMTYNNYPDTQHVILNTDLGTSAFCK